MQKKDLLDFAHFCCFTCHITFAFDILAKVTELGGKMNGYAPEKMTEWPGPQSFEGG